MFDVYCIAESRLIKEYITWIFSFSNQFLSNSYTTI